MNAKGSSQVPASSAVSVRKPSGSYFRVISLDKMRNDVAHVRCTGEKAKVVIA